MKSFSQQTIVSGTVINMSSLTVGRILRFALLILITLRFGASDETDAYFIAQSLCFLFLLMGEGLFNFSFLPVFVDYRERKGEEEAWKLGSCTFTHLNTLLAILTLLILIFAPFIASILAPGFSLETRSLTAMLMRITSPVPLLVGTSAICAVIFYSYRSFVVPATTAIFETAGPILAILLLAESLGIMSVAIGLVVGVGFRALILLYGVKRRSEDFSLSWNVSHPGMAKVANLSWPRFLGISLNNINLLVDRLLASGLGAGSVSCFTFAYRVFETPSAILIMAFGRTILPVFSEYGAAGREEKLQEIVSKSIRGVGFVTIPISIMFFIVGMPLISVLFERGAFDLDDAYLTATVFLFFDIGLVFWCFNLLLSGAFYALQDAMTPLKVGIVGAILNATLDLVLIKWLGLRGIALSTSTIAILNTFLLFGLLSKKVGGLAIARIAKALLRILLAASAMGLIVWSLQIGFSHVFTFSSKVLELGVLGLTGVLTYCIICRLLRVGEYREMVKQVRSRALS